MNRLLAIVAAAPAVVLAALIYSYGFNMPYWDQWEQYELFYHAHHHTLTIQELFSQHNEHRLFFTRLFLLSATLFKPYTDLAELWISWTMACLSAICLWRLARHTGWTGAKGLLLLLGANLLLFNLLAWEDWLWGFQIGFLLPVLCVVAGVWSVTVSRGPWQFVWAAFWSAVNSFTIASGFTTWIILIPLLLFPEGKFQFRWRGLLVHLLGLGLCLGLYLHGYEKPAGHPNTSTVMSDPQGALNYFLCYLGAPLADTSPPPEDLVEWITFVAGGFLVGVYAICAVLLVFFWRRSQVVARSLPWLTISHYGLCTAAITTVGRMGFGLGQALSSRYVVLSSLVPIGLLFAGACLFPSALERLKGWRIRQAGQAGLAAIPVLCGALYFWTVTNAFIHWQEIYQNRIRIQAALVFINVPSAGPLLTNAAYPALETLKRFYGYRAELGYPQTVLSGPVVSSLTDPAPPDPASGAITGISETPTGHTVSGWAFLPKARRSADLVFLTLPDAQNQDSIVGMAFPDGYDKTLGEKVQCPNYMPLKWSIDVPAGSNLAGLKGWSFDGFAGRAWQMTDTP
jgi:hypothetical protein